MHRPRPNPLNANYPAHSRERGLVLFIALIVLVAMTLVGLSMMRTVSNGILVGGNIGLNRAATHTADLGLEAGRKWLLATANLNANAAASGYYAEWDVFDNLTTQSWSDANSAVLSGAATPAGYTEVRYVIHRLCENEGASDARTCVVGEGSANGSKAGAIAGAVPLSTAGKVHYRVTARIVGAKGTVSYVQAILML